MPTMAEQYGVAQPQTMAQQFGVAQDAGPDLSPTQANADRLGLKPLPLSFGNRFERGALDIGQGVKQRVLQFEDWLGHGQGQYDMVDPHTGKPLPVTHALDPTSAQYSAQVNPELEDYQKRYEAGGYGTNVRVPFTKKYFNLDAPRALGGMAASAPAFLAAPELGALGAYGNAALQGAVGGGLTGFAQYDPENKFSNSVWNTGKGAAVGAVVAPLTKAIFTGAAKGYSALMDRLKGFGSMPATVDDLAKLPGFNDLPRDAQADLLRTAQEQQATAGGKFDPEQLARKANLKQWGLQDTQAMVTRDAGDWTTERNFQKTAIQSPDRVIKSVGNKLTNIYDANNDKLISGLDDFSSGLPPGTLEAHGNNVLETINRVAEHSQKGVSEAYKRIDAATEGKPVWMGQSTVQLLDNPDYGLHPQAHEVWDAAIARLKQFKNDEGMPFLDAKGEASGSLLTARQSEQFRQFVNSMPNVFGKRTLIQAIDNDSLLGLAGNDAYAPARAFAQERFSALHSPAIDTALNAFDELKQGRIAQGFIRNQIVNAPEMDVQSLAEGVRKLGTPAQQAELATSVRAGVMQYLNDQAIGGSGRERMFSAPKFAQSLEQIGDNKLSAFFSPLEVQKLHEFAQAGLDATTQPAHSAVNYSGSGTALMGMGGVGNRALQSAIPPFAREFLPSGITAAPERMAARSALSHIIRANGVPPVSMPNPLLMRIGQSLAAGVGPAVGYQLAQPTGSPPGPAQQ